MNDLLKKVFEQVEYPKNLALGYPVNRKHAFNINIEDMGIMPNSLSSTFINNVGSPFSPKTYSIDDIRELEQYVINLIFAHLGGEISSSFGYVTTGGTEGNFASVWWHREYLIKTFNYNPVLIASDKSHYSLDKIANQLQLKLVKLNSDNLIGELANFLKKNDNTPVIFWASLGTTVDGTIDDIKAIKTLLDSKIPTKYKIHADGAIYGLLIPYLYQLKHIKNIFTIIDSLSISGHKFLGAYNICGVVLTSSNYINEVFDLKDKAIACVRDAIDYTVSGSRPGMHIIELYLLLEEALKVSSDGKTNLEILWDHCLEVAKWFYMKLAQIVKDNKLLWYNPNQLSILIPAPKDEKIKFDLSKKYSLMPVGIQQIGIYVFPRSTKEKLTTFLDDYAQCLEFHKNEDDREG